MVLDIGMPKLNGYEDRASDPRGPTWGTDVVLAAVTGWGQAEDRRKSRAAGFDHHLVKPLRYDSLTAVLDTLARKEGRRELA